MNEYDFIKVGNAVFWHDPEGYSDGEYEIISAPGGEEMDDDSIILIANDCSEAEVFPTELSPV